MKTIEEYRKIRQELGEKYGCFMVDGVTNEMSDEDFLKYVKAAVHFQVLSGEHPIGKMGYVLRDALKERSAECLEKLADLLAGLKESLGLEGIEYSEKIARLKAIERKYELKEDDELEELPHKIKNPDDLVSYYQAKAIQITSEGFYPRILDYGVEHGHISEKVRKEIDIERERFKPRERRTDFS